MFLVWSFVSILSVLGLCSGDNAPLHEYSDGDIIIGGLFPFHLKTNRNSTHGPLSCYLYDFRRFLQSQAMIYAIREINQRTPRVLPNFTIGYDIYDTCGDVGFAIRATLQLLKNQSDPQMCLVPENFTPALPEPKTKAVIGESASEVSVAVARVLALSSVAQISYESTSEQLSRKLKFPTFLRTVSSDEYQTIAIAEMVKKFNWKTVAIIGSDDEYGKYGSDQLVNEIGLKRNVCIEFTEILPGYFSNHKNSQSHLKLTELVRNINKSSAEAIIMFTKDTNVKLIIEAAIKNKLNRTWIAGDTWSNSAEISELPGIEKAGEVFGFIPKKSEVPGFKDYIISMFNRSETTKGIFKHHETYYSLCPNQPDKDRKSNCSPVNSYQGSKHCLDLCCLVNYIEQGGSYNVYLAVQVIAEGLRHLLKCDNGRCKHDGRFTAAELLKEIKAVNFTVNTTQIFFDSNGDPRLGYDVLYWDIDKSKQRTHIKVIGEYWPGGDIKIPDDLVEKMVNVTVTAYNCSKTCKPGQELRENKTCCNHCFPCADGEFSAGNGSKCEPCGEENKSSQQKNMCLKKPLEFLQWSDPFVIILGCLEVFGIIVIIVFAVLFAIYRKTPIVKAVGGYLCFLELFSLLVCFCLTFTFVGVPTRTSCKVGLPVFGIALSLCMSCILANLLQILVGFNFEQKIGSWIKKLNKPLAVVIIVSGIQVALCVPWLHHYPPHPTEKRSLDTILLQCNKGCKGFFIAMVGYNAFLAISCFLFAFKGKQLPDLYKNASLVTISMTMFLVIWILFIPIYINLYGKHKRAIEAAAVLTSAYSILGCHLAPKCYIMLFRKEINNENAITEYIRKHYEQRQMAVVKS